MIIATAPGCWWAENLFYNDNAYDFQKVLRAAVVAYGIPMKLYVDNGSTYSSEQLS